MAWFGVEGLDILLSEDKIISMLLASSANGDAPAETSAIISEEMNKLAEKLINRSNPKGAVLAEEARMIKGLGHLQQKLTKSLKAKKKQS